MRSGFSRRSTNYLHPPTSENLLLEVRRRLARAGLPDLSDHDRNLLNNLTTIANIEECISRIYNRFLDEENATIRKESLRKIGYNSLERMVASSNNYDCLIHSFLTSISQSFRKLDEDDKNEFANFFRRRIFLTLPVIRQYLNSPTHTGTYIYACSRCNEEFDSIAEFEQHLVTNHTNRYPFIRRNFEDAFRARVMGKMFLSDTEIMLLAAQFRISIFTVSEITGRELRTSIYHRENLIGLLPPDVGGSLRRVENFQNTIGFYTRDNSHFEPLRMISGRNYYLSRNSLLRGRPLFSASLYSDVERKKRNSTRKISPVVKRIECPICDKTFVVSKSLFTHIMNIHDINVPLLREVFFSA